MPFQPAAACSGPVPTGAVGALGRDGAEAADSAVQRDQRLGALSARRFALPHDPLLSMDRTPSTHDFVHDEERARHHDDRTESAPRPVCFVQETTTA